jgi:hypothetical protein
LLTTNALKPGPISPYIIRTSDRQMFKTCRQKWDFGSKMRQDYELITGVKALDFGTAMHKAMEVFYDPLTWYMSKDIKESLAIKAFNDCINETKRQSLTINGMLQTELAYELEQDFKERKELGESMLAYYFWFSEHNDKEIEPVENEIEFEIPIRVPPGMYSAYNLKHIDFTFDDSDGILKYKHKPVLYQGRIDSLWLLKRIQRYAVVDHKTAGQFGGVDFLALDEQCSSYDWALTSVLNIDIAYIIYNQLKKAIAHKPKVLKNGTLSIAKNQNTTLELFMQAVEELNQSPEMYVDFIDFLKSDPKDFVRRIEVKRNDYQRKQQGIRIFKEAVAMLDNPEIYPSPGMMNCNGCWFYNPCVATNDGGDVKYFLSELYRKRKDPDGQE